MNHYYNPFNVNPNYSGTSRRRRFSEINWKNELAENEDLYISFTEKTTNEGSVSNKLAMSFYLSNIRKCEPDISSEYLEKLLKEVVDALKSKAGYSNAEIGLSTVDHYSSHTDIYEVPVVKHTKGKRTFEKSSEDYGYIPKAWEVHLSATFEGELSTRLRNSILSEVMKIVGLEFTDAHKKQIKKNLEKHSERYDSRYTSKQVFLFEQE